MKLKALLEAKYLGFGNQGRKPVKEYGEDEFSRGPEHYSGGSKDVAIQADNYEILHYIEAIEDELSEMKSRLATDSNIPTPDKTDYLQHITKIETHINSLQKELN